MRGLVDSDRVRRIVPVMGAPVVSRVRRLASRVHNEVLWDVQANVVTKFSWDREKIVNEAAWLLQSLDAGAVRVLSVNDDAGSASYSMEYVPGATVAALLTHGAFTPARYWESFFAVMPEFLRRLHASAEVDQEVRDAACEAMYLTKTQQRLEELVRQGGPVEWDTELRVNGQTLPSLTRVVECLPELDRDAELTRAPRFVRVHGDLCPGNMFFTPGGGVTLIDPRGSFGPAGVLGDPTYDLAKLAHSFIGGYDAIESGHFRLGRDTSDFHVDVAERPAKACRDLIDHLVGDYGISRERVSAVHALAMLSLAALHQEDPNRQRAFVVRGLQLFEGVFR